MPIIDIRRHDEVASLRLQALRAELMAHESWAIAVTRVCCNTWTQHVLDAALCQPFVCLHKQSAHPNSSFKLAAGAALTA